MAILDFQSEQFQLFLIYKLPQYFCHFKSIGLSVQEKQSKTDFQDGHHGDHLAFLIGMILAIFLTRFESIGLLVKEKSKIDFLDGSNVALPIRMISAIFDQQVTQMPPNKFRVNWSWGVGGVGF